VFRTGQLAATLQIVILSDTPAGMIPIKRHKIGLLEEGGFHDGVLSFYKTFRRDAPVKPEEFLSIWFLDMCRFFKDYGAPILVSVEKVPRKSTPLMFLERLFKPAAKRLHGNDMNKKLVSSGPQQEGPSPFNKFLQYLGVSQDDGPFHEDIALDSAMQNINKKISFLFEQMVTKLKMWNSQDDLKNKYAQVGSDPERRNAVLARAQRENDLKTRASLQPLFADLIKIQEEHQKEHPDQPWEHGELFWTAQSKPTEPGILHVALAMEDLGVFRKKGRLRWERRDQLRVRFPVLLEMPRALLSQENNTLEPLPPRIPIETQFGKGKLEIAVVEARRLKIPDLAKPSQAFAGEPLPALPTLQQRLHLNEVREKIGELLPDVTGTTSKAQRGSSSIKADFPTSHRPFIKLQLLDRKATDWESRCPRGHVLCLSYEAEAYWECQFRSEGSSKCESQRKDIQEHKYNQYVCYECLDFFCEDCVLQHQRPVQPVKREYELRTAALKSDSPDLLEIKDGQWEGEWEIDGGQLTEPILDIGLFVKLDDTKELPSAGIVGGGGLPVFSVVNSIVNGGNSVQSLWIPLATKCMFGAPEGSPYSAGEVNVLIRWTPEELVNSPKPRLLYSFAMPMLENCQGDLLKEPIYNTGAVYVKYSPHIVKHPSGVEKPYEHLERHAQAMQSLAARSQAADLNHQVFSTAFCEITTSDLDHMQTFDCNCHLDLWIQKSMKEHMDRYREEDYKDCLRRVSSEQEAAHSIHISNALRQMQEDVLNLTSLADPNSDVLARATSVCTALISSSQEQILYSESLLIVVFYSLLAGPNFEQKSSISGSSDSKVFYLLTKVLCAGGAFHDYFGKSREKEFGFGALQDAKLLRMYIEHLSKDLHNHMTYLGFEYLLFFGGIFMRLYASYMPTVTTFHFWDLLFYKTHQHGESRGHLVDLAVAVVMTRRKDLLACSSALELQDTILGMLGALYDVDTVIELTLIGSRLRGCVTPMVPDEIPNRVKDAARQRYACVRSLLAQLSDPTTKNLRPILRRLYADIDRLEPSDYLGVYRSRDATADVMLKPSAVDARQRTLAMDRKSFSKKDFGKIWSKVTSGSRQSSEQQVELIAEWKAFALPETQDQISPKEVLAWIICARNKQGIGVSRITCPTLKWLL